jgi:hypothetical protein
VRIILETAVKADLNAVWRAWSNPEDIKQWRLVAMLPTGTNTGDFQPIRSCPCRAYTRHCNGAPEAGAPLNGSTFGV